ncbi:MAG: hypothetical protein JSW61_01035 [Candidatus Thorarchaeota archaeon]|nr:MAG: hypothetical protein JSW61_01035 [Candidatus Thorarchaeota archaeon]
MSARKSRSTLLLAIVATALLNAGLFFLLFIFTSLVAGLIMGYFLREARLSALISFLGAMGTFVPLQLLFSQSLMQYLVDTGLYSMDQILAALPLFYMLLLISAVLLSVGGLLGGYLGTKIARQESTLDR